MAVEARKKIMHRVNIGDIPRYSVIVCREPAFLAKEHYQIQLGKLLIVMVMTIADVVVE